MIAYFAVPVLATALTIASIYAIFIYMEFKAPVNKELGITLHEDIKLWWVNCDVSFQTAVLVWIIWTIVVSGVKAVL